MLAKAKVKTKHQNVTYVCCPIEDYEYPEKGFDVVINKKITGNE